MLAEDLRLPKGQDNLDVSGREERKKEKRSWGRERERN